MNKTVVLIGTLDTKGPEIAYLRDRLQDLGLDTIVVDCGILGEPIDIVPDIDHAEAATYAGTTIAALQNAGSRGKAVAGMREALRNLIPKLFAEGRLNGVVSMGGAEGAVMGAAAMMTLPVGVPKVLVSPIASGYHFFEPLVGTRDMMVVHSVVDILGLNPIARTIFDNVAASLKGMLEHGHGLPEPAADDRFVAMTMLGNTTKAVMASVIDFTTNEIYDPMVGGIHDGGPERLKRIGLLGLPQVVVPGCIDFSVWNAGTVPAALKDRPVYDHNPEFTLVRANHEEMVELGHVFSERLNLSTGPTIVAVPTKGLSIPNVPDGPFWNPEADQAFLQTVQEEIRGDIQVFTFERHVNDPRFGREVAELFIQMMAESSAAN